MDTNQQVKYSPYQLFVNHENVANTLLVEIVICLKFSPLLKWTLNHLFPAVIS